MALERDLQRIESSLELLARVGRSRRGDALRSRRAGVVLTRPAQLVLRQVVMHGPARISDVARALHLNDAAASRGVRALVDRGLLARSGTPEDGRVAVVRATPAGRRVQQRLRAAQDEIFRDYLADWSARDLAALAGQLERLARDLHRPLEPAGRPRRARSGTG